MDSWCLLKLKPVLGEKLRAPELNPQPRTARFHPNSTPIPPDPPVQRWDKTSRRTERLIHSLCPKVEVVPKPVLPPNGVPKDLLNIFKL